jgi:hypothetical protein
MAKTFLRAAVLDVLKPPELEGKLPEKSPLHPLLFFLFLRLLAFIQSGAGMKLLEGVNLSLTAHCSILRAF